MGNEQCNSELADCFSATSLVREMFWRRGHDARSVLGIDVEARTNDADPSEVPPSQGTATGSHAIDVILSAGDSIDADIGFEGTPIGKPWVDAYRLFGTGEPRHRIG